MYLNAKQLREEFHLSAGYVARYLGITERTYLESERGDFPFTAQEMEKLCNLYGIPIEDIDKFLQYQEMINEGCCQSGRLGLSAKQVFIGSNPIHPSNGGGTQVG